MQELLGHAWVTTTQRYTHLEMEDLQDQLADLPGNAAALALARYRTGERE